MKVKLDDGAFVPTRAHTTDAGLDLYAKEDAVIPAHGYKSVDTGVHVKIPHEHFGLIASKSGLMGNYGITCRGIVDEGYTGAVKAILFNSGDNNVWVSRGMKITQLIVLPCKYEEIEIVDDLGTTERGDNGFGSTGR